MKLNKILIIAAIFLLGGITLIIGAMAMADFNINKISGGSEYEEKAFETSGNISEIKIDDFNNRIEIVPSDDDKIHITYFENNKEYYNIETNGEKLTVTKVNTRKWYEHILALNFKSTVLTLAIPDSLKGELNVQTSNGRINIRSTGAENIILKSSNGSITAENINAGKFQANTSNGKVNLKDIAVNGGITCGSSNGAISLEKVQGADINLHSSNGEISLSGVTSSGDIVAETSNSRITVDDISAAKLIDLRTSNGRISGEISGAQSDYTIYSDTSNGRNNLPQNMSGGEKTLRVKTSNGDISINFSGR